MSTTTMNAAQQSTLLAKDRAVRLAAAGHARWLQVLDGRVWATVTSQGPRASDDIVLDSGDVLELGARDEVVIEGLTNARVQLVEPVAALSAAGASRRGPATQAWVQRLSFSPAPSVCV